MSYHKKYNETKEYGDWDDFKKTVDDIKAILDTPNEKSNKKLKKLKWKVSSMMCILHSIEVTEMDEEKEDFPCPPVSLSEMSLDEAEDKLRSVTEAYDEAYYDVFGSATKKPNKNLDKLRQKKQEWNDFVEKINIQETNEAANDDPYLANVLKIIRDGKECVLCGKKGACDHGGMNNCSANRFHKCHSCGQNNRTIYLCSGNGKKDGRCGFFYCKTPGWGVWYRLPNIGNKMKEGRHSSGINIKWHK